jgi:hypothetical protein
MQGPKLRRGEGQMATAHGSPCQNLHLLDTNTLPNGRILPWSSHCRPYTLWLQAQLPPMRRNSAAKLSPRSTRLIL